MGELLLSHHEAAPVHVCVPSAEQGGAKGGAAQGAAMWRQPLSLRDDLP